MDPTAGMKCRVKDRSNLPQRLVLFVPYFLTTVIGVLTAILLYPLASWGKFGIIAGTIALIGWPIDAAINIAGMIVMSFMWLFTGEKIVPYDTAQDLKQKGWYILEYY